MAKMTMTAAQALALGILALQEAKDSIDTDARELAQAVKVLRRMKESAKDSRQPLGSRG